MFLKSRTKRNYLFSVFRHFVQILVFLPSTFLLCRLMANLRFDAMLEWLREFPAVVPRPQVLHTRLIVLQLICYGIYCIMRIEF